MTNAQLSDRFVADKVRVALNALLWVGLVLVVLGVSAIVFPMAATLVATVMAGWMILLYGGVGLNRPERRDRHSRRPAPPPRRGTAAWGPADTTSRLFANFMPDRPACPRAAGDRGAGAAPAQVADRYQKLRGAMARSGCAAGRRRRWNKPV